MSLDKLRELVAAAAKANNLPWKIYRRETPHYLGRSHIENCIGTVRDDPQLHGPYPTVTLGFGLGATKGDPAVPLLSIHECDANFIVAASEAIPDLESLLSRHEALKAAMRDILPFAAQFVADHPPRDNRLVTPNQNLVNKARALLELEALAEGNDHG